MRQVHTKLVTGLQMAAIDRRAIESGVPGTTLMEQAGRGVARVIEQRLGSLHGRRIGILCGRGNNGGDGFVVARLAAASGARVRTFLFADPHSVRGDALHHLGLARESGLAPEPVCQPADLQRVRAALGESDIAVDALLGTGLRGAATGLAADGIRALQDAGCPVVAVDVPSGLSADTGRAEGPCAAAACTVTFGHPKVGHLFYPGRSLCGSLHVVDIGLPPAAVAAEPVRTWLIAAHGAAPLLPSRRPDAHKGDCGRVVILAGSVGMTGAAALCGRAALRSGAGLVTVGTPASLNDILEVKLTEAMTRPLPEVRAARSLALRARGEIRRLAAGADAVAIGPGLGTHRETVELVRRLMGDIRVPLVVDADALNALAGHAPLLKTVSAPCVITPHGGEFARLTGQAVSDPCEAASGCACELGVTVVLKGAPSVVASPSGHVFVNPSGNAGMATAGSGDVLTGVIAGLLGQGLPAEQAACLGVYLHGLAGDLAAGERGQAGLVAGDIAEALPRAERLVRQGADRGRYCSFHPED